MKAILSITLVTVATTSAGCAADADGPPEGDHLADEADELTVAAAGTNLLANGKFDETNAIEGVKLDEVRKLRRWTLFAGAGGATNIINELGTTDLYQYSGKRERTTAAQLVRGEAHAEYKLTFGASTGGFGPGEQKVFLDFLDADKVRIAHNEKDVAATDKLGDGPAPRFRWNSISARAPRGTAFVRVAFVAPPDPPTIPDLPGAAVATRYDNVTLTK
ncbi:MAG: hypothetical protein U0270_03195 [Labilithrix sp.]